MLGCSIALPVIAVFGTSPPEVAEQSPALPPPQRRVEAARPVVVDPPQSEVIRASYETRGPVEDRREARSTEDPEKPPLADDRLATLQRRLEQLGATYYRLESCGNEGPRFRFECRVAFDRASFCARHFEATDRDPMQAIVAVVRQVEAWVAAQRTGGGS